MATHVGSRPVSASQFDSSAGGIHDHDSLGGEGKFDVLDVEEGALFF